MRPKIEPYYTIQRESFFKRMMSSHFATKVLCQKTCQWGHPSLKTVLEYPILFQGQNVNSIECCSLLLLIYEPIVVFKINSRLTTSYNYFEIVCFR